MSRFLETIRIENDMPLHLEWHQRRVDATLHHFYKEHYASGDQLKLSEILDACQHNERGVYRCRVLYDINSVSVEFLKYTSRIVKSLRIIEAPSGFDYRYKYADRNIIEVLFAQRRDADDILITRDGWITDTSIANIAFRKDDRWYTPSQPLLAGTTWKRLISEGVLIPRPIHHTQLKHFEVYRIFNAMNDWGGEEMAVGTIYTD